MAIDPSLPKDPANAADLLEKLTIKDQDETICRYPTCPDLRKTPEKGGKPPAYCGNPLHTAQRSLRARAYIEDLAKGLSPTFLETEQAVTPGAVQSLRDKALAELERFSGHLGLYIAALRELADPEIAAAQIEAAGHRADAQIAAVQETVETERSLRLSAEHLRDTAQRDTQAARDEAARASTSLQESEERARREREEHERQLAKFQQEHEGAREEIRAEAHQRIEETRASAAQAISLAQEAKAEAEEEARQANARARDAETEARARIESAQQHVAEAKTALVREQHEVERLRLERDTQASEARRQSEDSRKEIQQLRADLLATTSDARKRAEDDRTEIQHLRENLHRAIQRADDLARSNDTLRSQFVEIQTRSSSQSEHQEH